MDKDEPNNDELEILKLEQKVNSLSCEILSKSLFKDDYSILKKEYYKNLMISLRIIQRQKDELLNLKLKVVELTEEVQIKDIIKFCM